MRPGRPQWESSHNERMARMRAEHAEMDRKMSGCLSWGFVGIVAVMLANFAVLGLVIWGIYELIQFLQRH
jgi:hypothetical protein